jgi:hypothetical protein
VGITAFQAGPVHPGKGMSISKLEKEATKVVKVMASLIQERTLFSCKILSSLQQLH